LRRARVFESESGGLSSLNIMLESREGYESSTGACAELLRAGVSPRSGCATLIGPTSAVFGYEPGRLPSGD